MLQKATLFLLCLLLLLAGMPAAHAATGASPYARAKAKGRVFVHRPYYRAYRGRSSSRRHHWHRAGRRHTGKTRHHVGRTTL